VDINNPLATLSTLGSVLDGRRLTHERPSRVETNLSATFSTPGIPNYHVGEGEGGVLAGFDGEWVGVVGSHRGMGSSGGVARLNSLSKCEWTAAIALRGEDG
jgi:hypothetical protein